MRQFERHSSDQQLDHFDSEEYKRLFKDFRENGDKWTTLQLRHFFIVGSLEKEIGFRTGFNFNFDYKNPTKREYAHQEVIVVLSELWNIIQKFGIPISLLVYYPGMDQYAPLVEWFTEASEWVEEVIRPLLQKLKSCEPLSQLGGECERLEARKNKLLRELKGYKNEEEQSTKESELKILDEQISILQKTISDLIKDYIYDIQCFIMSLPKLHDVAQIKEKILHIYPSTVNPEARDIIDKLPPSGKPSASYQIETMPAIRLKYKQGFELLALGLIFLAQQEFDQPLAQRRIFNKIATLIEGINKPDLETMIRQFRFRRAGFWYFLDCLKEPDQSNLCSFVETLAEILRQILAKHQLSYLAAELREDRSSLDDPVWLDILRIFWHCYDKSPLLHNSYFYEDKRVYNNILRAAEHISRLENNSGESYIEKTGRPFQLKAAGFWQLISHILVSAHSNIHESSSYTINAHLFRDVNILFSHLTISELEMIFTQSYSPTSTFNQLNSKINLEMYSLAIKYIRAATKYIINYPLPLRDSLVNNTHEQKRHTPQMLQLLRAHLASDPLFGIIPKEESHNNPVSNWVLLYRMLQYASSFDPDEDTDEYTNEKAKSSKGDMELKPLNLSYGTFAARQHSRPAPSIEVDKEAVLSYQASEEEIITLAKQFFGVDVLFHNKTQLIPPRMNHQRPVLHLYAFNPTEMCLYIDPFPKVSVHITWIMALRTDFMIAANLTKEEIMQHFASYIPDNRVPRNTMFSAKTDDFARLMIAICNKCKEQNTTVRDVLEFILTNISKLQQTGYDSSRLDYLFYRFYGKSVAEVVANPDVSPPHENLEELGAANVSPLAVFGRRS